ncbi:4522_t:CDS:1, partial [Racocetra fulgida]
ESCIQGSLQKENCLDPIEVDPSTTKYNALTLPASKIPPTYIPNIPTYHVPNIPTPPSIPSVPKYNQRN